MDIPIEIFIALITTTIALGVFGFMRNPQIPAMMAFAGIFILFIAVSTDTIKMGNLVTQSIFNSTSNITNYSYVEDDFNFTELPKVLLSLIGVVFMLSGALMIFRDDQ